MIQFAAGREPVAVRRGGVRGPWLHARIETVNELDSTRREQLAAWLEAIGVDDGDRNPAGLLVSHDGAGNFSVHIERLTYPAVFEDMPPWLQQPMAVAPARKATKAAA